MITVKFLTSCRRYIIAPLLLIAFISTTGLWAQTTSTTADPDWTDNNDWTLTAPGYNMNQSATLDHNSTISGNDITVNDGFTLIINAGVTLTTDKVITVKSGGKLIINGTIIGTGDFEFKIDGGTLIINSGGVLDWAGKWNSKDPDGTITIDGTVIVRGAEFVNKSIITGSGSIEVLGELKNSLPGSIFGCTDEGDVCCPSGACVLPIDLISFYGIPRYNAIDIYWSTASELNNDFFTIERSKDGIQWQIIHTREGAGNSSTVLDYTFADTNPPIGLVYYRLKQTDYDGAYSYSDIIVVNSLLSKELVISYPNPAQYIFLVEMKDIEDREVLVSNSVGQQFYLPIKKYLNKIELDVSGLKSGMYFVNLLDHPSHDKISFIKKP
jgi:hypothetical protein